VSVIDLPDGRRVTVKGSSAGPAEAVNQVFMLSAEIPAAAPPHSA